MNQFSLLDPSALVEPPHARPLAARPAEVVTKSQVGPRVDLGQYMTPVWASQLLFERHFGDLTAGDAVWEPTCGAGAWLLAVPPHVEAVGSEIDPVLAEQARERTGRRVVTGDARSVTLGMRPTVVVGNPPYQADVIDGILYRCRDLLADGGRVGFLLPCYLFQTPSRVLRYNEDWSLRGEMVPRTLFPGLSTPLTFTIFGKDRQRLMVGFALYSETDSISSLPADVHQTLVHHPKSWREVCRHALDRLGGRAPLQDIYRAIEGRRPTKNPAWKEQVRKVLNAAFERVGPGEYALAA